MSNNPETKYYKNNLERNLDILYGRNHNGYSEYSYPTTQPAW